MTNMTFFNDLISVTASIANTGQVTPQSFTWQGKLYKIAAIGRQWETDEGRHVLVEGIGGDRFELQLSRTDLLWRLKRAWQENLA